MNCITCDLLNVADGDEQAREEALTVAYKLATDLGLQGVKDSMCPRHRERYVMSLARGARALSLLKVLEGP